MKDYKLSEIKKICEKARGNCKKCEISVYMCIDLFDKRKPKNWGIAEKDDEEIDINIEIKKPRFVPEIGNDVHCVVSNGYSIIDNNYIELTEIKNIDNGIVFIAKDRHGKEASFSIKTKGK